MGHLVTAHVFLEKPDFARLGELPKYIGYRVYLHRGANLYLLDTFRPAKTPQYPFQTLLPSADIPLELPYDLQSLERVYSGLGPLKLANGFKKSYINSALLLNRLLQVTVFSSRRTMIRQKTSPSGCSSPRLTVTRPQPLKGEVTVRRTGANGRHFPSKTASESEHPVC